MKKIIFLFFCTSLISGCGEINSAKKIVSLVSTENQSSKTTGALLGAGPYTPGSYFKLLKEVDSSKDTRLYEFKYKADGTFIGTQRSFIGGDLSINYFHKTIGTYKESNAIITHVIQYDTCNDLKEFNASVTGKADDIIRVVSKGSTIDFYSSLTWVVPISISNAAQNEVEDIGCKKF